MPALSSPVHEPNGKCQQQSRYNSNRDPNFRTYVDVSFRPHWARHGSSGQRRKSRERCVVGNEVNTQRLRTTDVGDIDDERVISWLDVRME